MPAQVHTIGQAFYQEGDTAPNLRRQLLDGAGAPIDLTGSTVTIDIAHESYDYYYSPMRRIIDADPCIVEIGTDGWVQWEPHDLTPRGTFKYRFTITDGGGKIRTVPTNTYETLIVTQRTGGPA